MERSNDVIAKDIEYIKQFIEEDRKRYSAHVETSDNYRDRVVKLELQHAAHEVAFKTHCEWDRWLFGLIITIGLAGLSMLGIMVKVVIGQ